jgi:two-component system, OmpR family, sensor histidine kinase ResE
LSQPQEEGSAEIARIVVREEADTEPGEPNEAGNEPESAVVRAEQARYFHLLASELEERVLERTEEVERQQTHLRAIVEQLPVGVVIVDASTERVITMNDEADRILQPFHGSADLLPLEAALVDGEAVLEKRLELGDAEDGVFTLQFSAVPVRDGSGQIVSAVATIQDVSAEERRERAEREFVTNAAHELQSPLAAITSAIEVLQSGAKDSAERDLFLGHIERATLRLGRVVRALLTLARLQTGVEPPRPTLIELCPMLEALSDRMEPREGVALTVDCPRDLGVLASRDLLDQALTNLAHNAAKYTKTGSITLSGRAASSRVEIVVADTGRGIPADVLPRVFDRFYRSGPLDGGFGIGLAIVQACVQGMRGDLEIESAVGEGTTVTIRLPRGATLARP